MYDLSNNVVAENVRKYNIIYSYNSGPNEQGYITTNNELRNLSNHSVIKENVKDVYCTASGKCYYIATDDNLYELSSNQRLIGQNVKKVVSYLIHDSSTTSYRPYECYLTNDNKLYVIGEDKSYNNVADAYGDGTYLSLDKKLYKIVDGTKIADNVEKHLGGDENSIHYLNTDRQLILYTAEQTSVISNNVKEIYEISAADVFYYSTGSDFIYDVSGEEIPKDQFQNVKTMWDNWYKDTDGKIYYTYVSESGALH